MLARLPLVIGLLLGACSGGAGDDPVDAPPIDTPMLDAPVDVPAIDAQLSPNLGFVVPAAVTKANIENAGAWIEVGDADWSCLGTPSPDQPSTGTIALAGRVRDFQTGNGVGNATITAWSTAPGSSVGTTTSSEVAVTRGDYAMTLDMLPSGTRRYGFSLSAASYLDTRVLGRYYPPGSPATDDLVVVSEATALALPAFIGLERDPATALHVGTMLDCQGRHVSNAVVGLSLVPTTYVDAGGQTFYFSAGSTSLPVRHVVEPVMNNDGRFTVLDAPPGDALHLQVWGFRTQAELAAGTLTLLGEIAAPSEANQAITMTLHPRRT
ncbi:MAG: carboxypeptidase regulatory-like domain-containing protein [Kofleriaceae bacterium]|nr:MAG: carboxypeptidase regulatory-like domain-containing protein [Kofleriaceae bacterium]MBZ0237021.1 hypothetical protein [Kofleriaceae bacterium]